MFKIQFNITQHIKNQKNNKPILKGKDDKQIPNPEIT